MTARQGTNSGGLHILYEDNHCLAVVKPAGWLTMGDQTGEPTLLDAAKDYIARKYAKPGAVFLGVVHRLDRPVSGVVLYARTSKGAARLSEQFRARTVEKTYVALVEGSLTRDSGRLADRLVKNRQSNVSRSTDENDEDGRDCELEWRVRSRHGAMTLLEIHPLTGRSHQIRVQLSNAGWPIVGDRKYGARRAAAPGVIALHAERLRLEHPTLKTPLQLVAAVPASWQRWMH